MAFKNVELEITSMSYNLGVIIATSYLYNDKKTNLLGEAIESMIETLGKDNLELDIIKGAIKETIGIYIRENGIDSLADNILSDYKMD